MKEEGYNLKESAGKIGQLYPVLLAADGKTIIDGVHRTKADPNWPSRILENVKTDLEVAERRLIGNIQRRNRTPEERTKLLVDYARVLEKELKPKNMVAEIVSRTGFGERWVQKCLPKDWKRHYNKKPEGPEPLMSPTHAQTLSRTQTTTATCPNCKFVFEIN